MGKGVLLELTGRQAVVLTPQGEFKRVPKPKGTCDIGDEIEYAESQQPAWTRWGMVAAAAVMLLAAPTGYNVWADAQPAAIVTVDINPSLELTLNRKDAVLNARPLNEDGALVLEGVEWNRKPVDEVLTAVTTRAVEEQKLDPASESAAVLVAVAPVKKDLPKAHADRVRDEAFEAVTEVAGAASVAVLEVTLKQKAAADAIGLNAGQGALYETMVDGGLSVTPEEVKTTGVGKLIQEKGGLASEIFSQSQKEHGGEPASKGNGKGKEKNEPKSQSGNGNGASTPTLPVLGQPVVPGKADDKGDQQKDNKQSDDKQTDDSKSGGKQPDDKQSDDKQSDDSKSDDSKSDDGKSDDGKSDDKKADDKQADVKPGHNGNNGNKGGQGNTEPVKPGSDKSEPEQEGKQDKPKGNEKKEQEKEKKSSWTIPFLGIEIEKPAFLQDRKSKDNQSTDAATEPRANTPGDGASDENDADQDVEEKQEKGSQGNQKEKPDEKPNKQEEKSKPSGGQNQNLNSGKK